MTKHFFRNLTIAGLMAGASTMAMTAGATAADLGEKVVKPGLPVMTAFNPWMIRVRGIGVIPGGSNRVRAGAPNFQS